LIEMGSRLVRLETLLPLGKVDPGLRAPETPLNIWSVGVVTDIEFSIGVGSSADRQTLADLARTVQQADDSAARAAIAGTGVDTATGE